MAPDSRRRQPHFSFVAVPESMHLGIRPPGGLQRKIIRSDRTKRSIRSNDLHLNKINWHMIAQSLTEPGPYQEV
jgi:hypothetical protein